MGALPCASRPLPRCSQALRRKVRLRAELLPGGSPDELLELVRWPRARGAVLVVGHQPLLGRTAARLLGMQEADCTIRKGAVWWLRHRQREEAAQTVLLAVQSPDFL